MSFVYTSNKYVQGLIVSTTRRHATISILKNTFTEHTPLKLNHLEYSQAVDSQTFPLLPQEQIQIKLINKWAGSVVPGDYVVLDISDKNVQILELCDRRNILQRSYFEKTKIIASNIDNLYITTAPPPLFNTFFIDRIITEAVFQKIPCSIILNKIDLKYDGQEQVNAILNVYLKYYGIKTFHISVYTREGLDNLMQSIHATNAFRFVAFCGVSGAGKSSLINTLVPGALRKTGALSQKSGQGAQTTSDPYAVKYIHSKGSLFLLDCPGIQNYGLFHLDKTIVRTLFKDFMEASQHCQFRDCMHMYEKECGVKKALEEGRLISSRYESYLNIILELENARKF
jgi:ribosome biogenesis GTPase / thiamine phosphate phosphatase